MSLTSLMQQVIAWFGWGYGIGALAGISLILTVIAILSPVIAGYLLNALERLQINVLKCIDHDFAYFFVNFVTFPGTFLHEMAHLTFAIITGAQVTEICMFESGEGRLGHIGYHPRGPWFIRMVQHATTAMAPTVVGLALGFVLLRTIWAGGHSVWAYIGLWYLVISVIDHSTMSTADLELYFRGVWIFVLPLFAFFMALGLAA